MIYDYIIVDSKLLAFKFFHIRQSPSNMFKFLHNILDKNDIKYKKVLYAGDWNKSSYRLKLQPDYKGGRRKADEKLSTSELIRKKEFSKDYLNMHPLMDVLGSNLQRLDSTLEADDMYSIVRYLRPKANILLVSLDEDWYFKVHSGEHYNTHLLKFNTNDLITTPNQVEELFGLPIESMIDFNAIVGQKKDSIHGLVNIGKARFKKHLLPYPKEEWWSIIDDLIKTKKYNTHLSPLAKHKGVLQQYHHNLLIMNPVPISEHSDKFLSYVKSQLSKQPNDISYEDFMLLAVETIGDIVLLSYDEFRDLKEGNV